VRTELGLGCDGIEVDDEGREVVGSSEDGKDEGGDGLMNGAKDRTAVGFTLGSEVGMKDGMKDETAVGTSLKMRIGDAMGNED
jgi:TATA-binding protein-associated factor Taf7